MADNQDSKQEVPQQSHTQQITYAAIAALPSLFMGVVMIINALKRSTKPNLAVQLLDNEKKIKLTKLNYQNNQERLNLNYQRTLKSLTIEREILQKQAKLLLVSRNLEVGIEEQDSEKTPDLSLLASDGKIKQTATNMVDNLKEKLGEGGSFIDSLVEKSKKK